MIVVRTSFRGAPRRIIFNASNTVPLGSVCAGDGDVGSACRLGDPLAFAIYQRPVSRDASSIAQTDVRHFTGHEVLRNSRASLACRNHMEHDLSEKRKGTEFADMVILAYTAGDEYVLQTSGRSFNYLCLIQRLRFH